MTVAPQYDAESFTVLKGLEPVRARPGMYTRTESPLHILQEVLDNAADEALAGYAKRIRVSVEADGWYSVKDDGRGIPLGVPPGETRPAIELAFTALHAGGKFDKTKGGSAYRFAGGLHGVGVAVTNALSLRLETEVRRNGEIWQMAFEAGQVVQALKKTGTCKKGQTGTLVRFQPDPHYFDQDKIHLNDLRELLRAKAVLLPGLTTMLRTPDGSEVTWCYPQGMGDYLLQRIADSDPLTEVFTGAHHASGDNGFEDGEGGQWALAWTRENTHKSETFVNLIQTPDGGTHEAGFRAGVFEAVRTFMTHHNLMPAKLKLVQDDVTAHLTFVLSSQILDPQFQGQTKDRLTSREAHRLSQFVIKDPLELWLQEHPEQGRAIAEQAIQAAQQRNKQAAKVERKRGSGLATLPGKLTDCESTDISRNELFLVEGDSAGGSAKNARDKEFQAILPLRGKILNTWEVEPDQLFSNAEVHDIAVALGIDPHNADSDPTAVLAGLRYGKVILFSDADVDGSHIQVLLMTLFLRHFPHLLQAGHLFVAKPPLYRVDAVVKGKPRKLYCETELERDRAIVKLRKDGAREDQITIQRFKGLGEMNPEQLWETGMNPDTRTLVPLGIQGVTAEIQERFTRLMGKREAGSRRQWLEQDGWKADLDI